MKNLDPRSVLIGCLVAVIGFVSMGANAEKDYYDKFEVKDIVISENGSISFKPNNERTLKINIDGFQLLDEQSGDLIVVGKMLQMPSDAFAIINDNDISYLNSKELVISTYVDIESIGPITTLQAGEVSLSNQYGNDAVKLAINNSDLGGILLVNKDGELKWGKVAK